MTLNPDLVAKYARSSSRTEHIVDFYKAGDVKPFARGLDFYMAPRVGDEWDALGVVGRVVSVKWTADTKGASHLICCVFIEEIQ